MAFTIKIEPEVRSDIQEGIDWYNRQESGLGRQFHTSVQAHIKKLQSNPYYQVRYDNVHCMPLRTFPYMIHFTIDESQKQVVIHGIFSTHRDPKIWKKRL